MRLLGRELQRLALILLPIAIVLELFHAVSLGQMLIMMIFGAAAFGVGRIVEGYAGS